MSNILDVQAGREIGGAIRRAREANGLSQTVLSQRAGVSRSTLHSIEHFDGNLDVGLLKVSAAAREAGLMFGIYRESPQILERRLERERAANRTAGSRESHLRIAAELAIGDEKALRRLEDARRMVNLWRRNGACSPRYIEAWSEILDSKPSEVARRLLSIEPGWLNAMFQNTPFGIENPPAVACEP
jgi:transcriptional regulator with XRE-family HTH domain